MGVSIRLKGVVSTLERDSNAAEPRLGHDAGGTDTQGRLGLDAGGQGGLGLDRREDSDWIQGGLDAGEERYKMTAWIL